MLGVAWQEGLGELKVNYKQSYIKFSYQGSEVCLQGNQPNVEIESIPASNLHQLIRKNEVSQCFMLQLVNTQEPLTDPSLSLYSLQYTSNTNAQNSSPQHHIQEATQLLSQFPDIFVEPKHLPPKRAFDHHIPLELNAKPVNMRP